MANNAAKSGGVGFFGLLALLLIALRLVGVIAWPWWVVLAPLWVPLAAAALLLAVAAAMDAAQRAEIQRAVDKSPERDR